MVKKGVNMEGVKSLNKKSILNYLRIHGANSRKVIAQNLNLTTAALSILTNELINEGLILELGELAEGKVGRKQVLLDLSPSAKYSLGLEISKGKVNFSILDFKANLVFKKGWNITALTEEKLDEILEFIKLTLANEKFDVLGLGILISGYIYENTHWNIYIPDLKDRVEAKLNIPVTIKNNMRGLVQSELYGDKDPRSFWLLKYGPGVGSSIVLDGEVIPGINKRAGEIGHIILSGGESRCEICGQTGCLESEISFENLLSKMGYSLSEKNSNESDFSFLKRVTSPKNEKIIYEALTKLAEAVAIGYTILDTGNILLAGEIFAEKEYYDHFIQEIVKRNRMLSDENINLMAGYSSKMTKAASLMVLEDFFKKNHDISMISLNRVIPTLCVNF